MSGSRMKTFDSWAWVEYFRGSSAGKEVREMIEGDEVLFTPAICLTELKVKYVSEGRDPTDRLAFIKLRTSITPVDDVVAEEAADLKIGHRLHTVDALVLACARKAGGELVTGDRHFSGIPGIAMLPANA